MVFIRCFITLGMKAIFKTKKFIHRYWTFHLETLKFEPDVICTTNSLLNFASIQDENQKFLYFNLTNLFRKKVAAFTSWKSAPVTLNFGKACYKSIVDVPWSMYVGKQNIVQLKLSFCKIKPVLLVIPSQDLSPTTQIWSDTL